MRRPIPWTELAFTAVMVAAAVVLAHSLAGLGVPKWLCWTLFGVIFAGRLVHGWITTRRPLPAAAVPLAVRLPLDAVTLGTLWGAWIR